MAVHEARMAEVAGIPQRVLSEVRGFLLKKDADWLIEDKRVVIQDEAAGRLLRALEVPAEAVDAILKKTRGEAVPDAGIVPQEPHPFAVGSEKTAKVARVFPNPSRLSAYLVGEVPEKFRRIIVRVQRNANFTPGMEIPVRRVDDDLWDCTRAAPRFRGRW